MRKRQNGWLSRFLGRRKTVQTNEDYERSSGSIGLRTWQPGKVVADIYEVVCEIGRGGMGVVYLLREVITGRPAAAKLPTGEFITDKHLRKRFTREAQVWTELAAHPNIVRAYDVQEIDYLPCLFMEYMDGGSVAERLEACRRGLPFEEAFSIAIQASLAMAFAHEKGHVHRDIKPSNLLCTRDGVVKVTDFGLVRPVTLDEETVKQNLAKLSMSFDADLAASVTQGSAAGTMPYMAPELWEGEASPAVDIYAFGVTLCELFCGQRPLDLRTRPRYRGRKIDPRVYGYLYKLLHQQEEPLDPASLRRGLPPEVRDLILQCLAKRPERRPVDFDAVAAQLVQSYKDVTGRQFPLKRPEKVELDREQKKNRAWALIRLAEGCEFRGDLKEAMSLYQQSKCLFQEDNDRCGFAACYTGMGKILLSRGDRDTALELFQESLKIVEELHLRDQKAICYLNIGVVLHDCGDLNEARKMLQRSLAIYKELGDRHGIGDVLFNMGNLLQDRAEYDAALEKYRQSLKISEGTGARDQIAGCYNNMALIFKFRGEYDKALDLSQKALAIAESIGERNAIAGYYMSIANLLKDRGEYDKALEKYQQSLKIAEELGDRATMAGCYLGMGNYLRYREDYDGALECYQQSLKISEEIGDQSIMASCYGNRGNILEDSGDYDAALECYQHSRKIFEEIGDRAGTADCYSHIGNLFRLHGKLSAAWEMCEKSLKIREELGDRAGQAHLYLIFSGIIFSMGEVADALVLCQESLKIYEELVDRDGIAGCCFNMGMLYENSSDKESALEMYERCRALKRELGSSVPEALLDKIRELGG